MSNFKIGQKVVCVKPIDSLVKNEIYTILSVLPPRFKDCGIVLKEVKCEFFPYAFKSSRFRPLDHQFAEDVIKMICEQPETVEI